MRALELHALDGPAGLRIGERPDPRPDGSVVVDVRSAGVSFPDLLVSQGKYQVQPELPAVLGLEVAGVVSSAPPAAEVRPGDRVWATVDGGGFAERIAVDPGRVFPLPDGLDFDSGAALGINYMTAAVALGRRGGLREGERLLVLGAAGGLGTALVGIGKARGARVIAVVSTADKAPTARRAGADAVVVGPDWRDAVLEETAGAGVEVAADVVGGDETLQAVRTLVPEGRLLILGFTSGAIPALAANRLLLRNATVVGVGFGALVPFVPTLMRETAAELTELVGSGLRPIVGERLPLDRGAEALDRLARRAAQGKIVLVP